MSIVFIHSHLPVGGAEVLRKTVIGEMLRRGADLRICLIYGGGEIATELVRKGVAVDVLGCSNSIYNPLTTLRLARYLRHHRPDIVQSSQFNSNYHARIAARLAGIPAVICEEHGLYPWTHAHHRWLDRRLAGWCDRIVAVSGAVKDFNVREIGIPEGKFEVLHNCLETDHSDFKKSRAESRAGCGFAADDFVVGHVGTLRKEKAHDILLKAFARLRKQRPAKLLLVGDGPFKGRIIEQVDSLGLEVDVIFAGSRSDVPDLLKAMDLFVFPSRNEALGIALLEAMYGGLPIVAAKTGGIPEIVEDGKTGLLVESEDVEGFADAMLHLAGNPELRHTLGNAAREYVALHHSHESYADRLSTIHDQLLFQKGLS
jgi:glycosyltransferase involved in cell wall biosynthesis